MPKEIAYLFLFVLLLVSSPAAAERVDVLAGLTALSANEANDGTTYSAPALADDPELGVNREKLVAWLAANEIPPGNFAEICLEGFGCRRIRPLQAAELLVKPEIAFDLLREVPAEEAALLVKGVPPQNMPPPETIPPSYGSICGKPVQLGFWECSGHTYQECSYDVLQCPGVEFPGICPPESGQQRVTYEWSWFTWECIAQCGQCS